MELLLCCYRSSLPHPIFGSREGAKEGRPRLVRVSALTTCPADLRSEIRLLPEARFYVGDAALEASIQQHILSHLIR